MNGRRVVDVEVSELAGIPERARQIIEAQGVEELYPPQSAAVEAGIIEGENVVASVPTASGKTLMAVLSMLAAIDRGGTALYIVPLRALASEKHAEFSEYEEAGVSVGLSMGDYESADEWLSSRDIIVATSEKVDSLIRNDASWLEDLTCVVADEVHLVNDTDRGPTLEVTVAKLRRINPDIQTVALSATIGNADEIAAWLDASLVDSDWRPIDLRLGIHYGQALHYADGETVELPIQRGDDQTGGIARDTLTDGGSTLVFVNSRRNAEAEAQRLGRVSDATITAEERAQLADVAADIRDASDTQTSEKLANIVERGAAFHHAGLCVTGDTQILRPDGTFDDIRKVIDRPSGGGMGLNGFSVGPMDITDTFEMGDRPVLQVRTRTGNELKLSKNHPLPVLGEEGIDWIPAGDLEEGMHISRPRKLTIDVDHPELRELVRGEHRVYRKYEEVRRLAGKAGDVTLDNDRLTSYGYNRNIQIGDFRQLCDSAKEDPNQHLGQIICTAGQKPISVPRILNKDLCWLVGAVAGDGYTTEKTVVITGRSHLLDEFEVIVSEHFDRDVFWSTSSSGTPKVTFGSKLIADLLDDHFGIPRGAKSGQLEMPGIPLPDNLLAAYISGLFDTDGSVSARANENGSSCIEFYTNNEKFIKQLKTSLLRFGILAFLDTRKMAGRVNYVNDRSIKSRSDVQRLTIYGTDQLRRFQEVIGFRHEVKSRKLAEAIRRNPAGGRNQNDVIPTGLGGRVREIRQLADLSLEDLDPVVPKATLSRYENGVTPMKRETFRRLARQFDDEILTAVATSDIFWDRIESIEERDPEPLFDLSTTSSNFIANGIIAHNTSDQRSLIEDAFRDRLIKIVSATPTLAAGVNTPSRRVIVRDWRRYDGSAGGMVPLSTLEVHQMFGRAGRPGMDPYGEAVLLASNHGELEELRERYIWAEPEPVQSKLAAEPALRTHVLSTVADGFANSREELLDFLAGTLYAEQAQNDRRIASVADRVVEYLRANDFVERDGDSLFATSLGHTVSRLYLDPMSAAEIIDGLDDAGEEPTALGLYHLVCRTPDLYEIYLRSGDRERYGELCYEREDELLGAQPSEFEEARFEDWLAALKTARLLEDWASEVDEDRLTDRYNIGPGDVRAKVDAAEWLLNATERLAVELDLASVAAIRQARKRVADGVGAELLDLVEVRAVGRKRARWLYDAGITSRSELRAADPKDILVALKGRQGTTQTILENVGHPEPDVEGLSVSVPDHPSPSTVRSGDEDPEDQSRLGDF